MHIILVDDMCVPYIVKKIIEDIVELEMNLNS